MPSADAAFLSDVAVYESSRDELVSARRHKGAAYLAAKTAPPFTGLINQGGTCYLNSLLQALFATDPIRTAVYRWRYAPSLHGPAPDCLPSQLQHLFGRLALSTAAATGTEGLTSAFGWTSEDAFVQHDAQELARVLLEALERADAAAAATAAAAAGTTTPAPADPHAAAPGALAAAVRSSFTGTLADSLTCHGCGGVRTRLDDFADLELSLVDAGASAAGSGDGTAPSTTPLPLTACLRAYTSAEVLTDGNRITCPTCGVKSDVTKRLSIRVIPPCLMLHLKRFRYDPTTGRQVKITDAVDIPFTLDMGPFVEGERGMVEGAPQPYGLYAVLMHSGGAGGGHYFAFIRRPGGGQLGRGEWLLFNDALVTELTQEEVAAAMQGARGSDAGGQSTPLAKPQYAEAAPVKPTLDGDSGGPGCGPGLAPGVTTRGAAKAIPHGGTPYLLLYRAVAAPLDPSAVSFHGKDAMAVGEFGVSVGAHTLPTDVLQAITAENGAADRLRAAADARRRLVEVSCWMPHTVHADRFTSGPDYVGGKPATWVIPTSMTLSQLTDVAYARWLESVVAGWLDGGSRQYGGGWAQWPAAAGDGDTTGATATLQRLMAGSSPPLRSNVRLRRYDSHTRLPLDTYSTEVACSTVVSAAGWGEAVSLMLEVRPPTAASDDGVSDDAAPASHGPPAWPEYDPHALTVRVYRWNPTLRGRLAATAAAIAAATAGASHHATSSKEEAEYAAALSAAVSGTVLQGLDASQIDAAVAAEMGVVLPARPAATHATRPSPPSSGAVDDGVGLEFVDITFPGVQVHGVTLDDLTAAIARTTLRLPPAAQASVVLAQGGLPLDVTGDEGDGVSGGGGGGLSDLSAAALSGSILSKGGPVMLRPALPGSTGLYRDCGATNGDAIIVEVAGEGEAVSEPPESYALLKQISSSEGVTVCANVVIPDAWPLPDSVRTALLMLISTGGATTTTSSLTDAVTAPSTTATADSKADGSSPAPLVSPSSTTSDAYDMAGMDEETRAAIMAMLATDEAAGGGGGGGGEGGHAGVKALHSPSGSRGTGTGSGQVEPAYAVQVRARRLDRLADLKHRIAAAITAEAVKRLPEAWAMAACTDPIPALLPLDGHKCRLARNHRAPHWRDESLRLHDLDIGHLASVFIAPGPPLKEDEVVVQPTVYIPVGPMEGGSASGVPPKPTLYSLPLPRLVFRQANRVSTLRKQLLTHVQLAVDKVAAGVRGAGAHPALPPHACLTPHHLRLRVRNAPAQLATTPGPVVPVLEPSVPVSACSSMLRDDAALRSGMAAVSKAVQAANDTGGSSGTSVDGIDMVVEVLPAAEVLTAADMVLRMREYRPSAGSGKSAVLTSPIEVVAWRHATTASLPAILTGAGVMPGGMGGEGVPLIRIAKPPSFGPPVTATTASALKWEAVPGTGIAVPDAAVGDAAPPAWPTLADAPLASAPLTLRDGSVLLWRRDAPTPAEVAAAVAAGAKPAARRTGAAFAREYGRVQRGGMPTTPTSPSGGGTSMDGMVVVKGGGAGATTTGSARPGGERGIRIRMVPTATTIPAQGGDSHEAGGAPAAPPTTQTAST